jgi:four helix bundle protein
MKQSVVAEKSKSFAIRVVKLYKYLTTNAEQKEYILSKQLMRSGTSVGANVKEALRAQSRADFRSKLNIALKEASESEYWIELLGETDYITNEQFKSLIEDNDNRELIKILTSIVKTTENS